MKICIVGLGYIGLPTAAMFASHDFEVLGVDVNPHVVEQVNQGKVHIEEPGLEDIIDNAVKTGYLRASTKPEESDVFIITVPTPNSNDGKNSCDLTYVLAACRSILPYIKRDVVVLIESTIAPRSMDDYIKPIFSSLGFTIGDDLFLAHCPERVLPGKVLHELKFNNRIVGGMTPACSEAAADIYRSFVKGEIIITEAKTAEMSKCMENTFRDVNIALANELSRICLDLDINVLDVIQLANKHPRVNIHQPGPGVGGHCLAVDPYFVSAASPENSRIIQLSRATNDSMPQFVVNAVDNIVHGISEPKIAILGVTYKGNIDDTRESPAIEIIKILEAKYQITIHDPHVKNDSFLPLEKAAEFADLLLVLSDHDEFKVLNHAHLAKLMRHPVLFDTKNTVSAQAKSGLTVINYGNLYEYKSGVGLFEQLG